MADLPAGTVTFLFTDVEGSTRLWEEQPEAMGALSEQHDEIVRGAIEAQGGHVVKPRGDGFHAAFAVASAAVASALSAQRRLGEHDWGRAEPLRVRIGLHTGTAALRAGDYFGSAVNRAARIADLAHGGQVLCSQTTADLARDELPGDVVLEELGEYQLRDLSRPERVFQVSGPGVEGAFPPLRAVPSQVGNLPPALSSFVGRR